MKINYSLVVCLIIFFSNSISINAQKAFNRGSLLISISEGHTAATYKTTISPVNDLKPAPVASENMIGVRDPLIIEYGITDRISIGLTSGNDIFKVKPSKFYGFSNSNDKVVAKTGELTFDSNYHFLVNKRLDVSACFSFGIFLVGYSGKEEDVRPYKYEAVGGMVRGGVKARYYFYKRFGAFGMISSFAGAASPKDIKDNTVGKNYSTSIKGSTIEAGLCYRFF